MKYFSFFIAGCMLMGVACKSENKENKTTTDTTTMQPVSKDTTSQNTVDYSNVAFDNKKDPVCGMPVTAGVSDTAHYNKKVLGFCSKECKDEFLEKPAGFSVE